MTKNYHTGGLKPVYKDIDIFIEESNKIHNNKYDYSKFVLVNSTTPGIIICPEHGEFLMKPWVHLYGSKTKKGSGCPICANKERSQTLNKDQQWFFDELKTRREDKGEYYDYSKVVYKKSTKPIEIICPKHGPFLQTPYSHLSGQGCPTCGHDSTAEKKTHTQEEFLEMLKQRYDKGEYYDYSKSVYTGFHNKIEIGCPKHGPFWQAVGTHILNNVGCPVCKLSKLEEQTRIILEDLNIKYEPQKRFDWLGRQSLDFYLPDHKIAIECQGIQHYKSSNFFTTRTLKEQQLADDRKYAKCKYRGIRVRYIRYDEKDIYGRILKILNRDGYLISHSKS